ncbi:MAG TPA: hypothetical protein PLO62_12860 [Candidatus Hydrogenedentes bacterium]|nr:hypothetical protein [Candidatus Hydrogenedentota bacterium]HOS02149.1 hypothetical protein [Candidatus Hydrogenedentota bacterium]
MECGVCSIRSAVGYCAKCKALLCDACAVPCEKCGALSCPAHIHITRSQRKICLACFDERQAQKTAQSDRKDRPEEENTAFSDEEKAPRTPARIEAEALSASGYKSHPLWRISLYTAIAGLAAMLFVLVFSSFQYILVPLVGWVRTPMILLLIPAIAIFWAAVGLFREPYYMDRLRCLMGAAIALVTIALGLGILQARAASPTESAQTVIRTTRDAMTPAQLEEWRQNMLRRHESK